MEKLTADRKAFIAAHEKDEIAQKRQKRREQWVEQEAARGCFDTHLASFAGGRSGGGSWGGGGNFGGGGGGNSGRRDDINGADSPNFDSNRNRKYNRIRKS